MSKAFSLLSSLNTEEEKLASEVGKTKYQVYNIQLGFESVRVCIPVDLTEDFEIEITENISTIRTAPALDKFAKQFSGFVQD